MTRTSTFRLIPFSAEPLGEVAVAGSVSRDRSCLQLRFRISGEIGSLRIPGAAAKPSRRDELWRSTCCECFFRIAGAVGYYELNVSPSGDWNLYHFQAYRSGMAEVSSVLAIACTTLAAERSFILDCAVPMVGLAGRDDQIDIGVSCVLAYNDGGTEYWALAHPGQQPDFHHPEGFLLRL